MTNRKKWPRKLVIDVFNKPNNPHGINKCWHCGKNLIFKSRSHGQPGAWHIDHYPVQYVDIESQICCGITDQLDINNLVPSCIECNISHKYEKKYIYFCNRSQCCCTYDVTFIVILVIILTLSAFMSMS